MKILMTVTGSWGTGSFQVVSGTVASLLEMGHQVKVFFPDAGLVNEVDKHYYENKGLYDIWSFPIENNHARLETFPLMLTDPNPRSVGGKTFLQLTTAERELYFSDLQRNLIRVIDDFQPDVIECQHIWAMDHVVSQLGLPFISVAHNSDQLAFEYDKSMRASTCASARAAKYIFAISDAVREKVISLYGGNRSQFLIN